MPVDEVLRGLAHFLPPDIAVVGQRDVGEQGVARLHRLHGNRVGVVVGARRHAEEAVLRVDCVQAVLAQLHPGDVIAHNLSLPARDGRGDHGQVGLTAGRREGGRDVVLLTLRVGELEDEHVLCHPALFLRHDGSDTQRVALLGQDGVSAVAGAVGPNLLGCRELRDVLLVIARPRDILLAWLQRSTNGVQGVDKIAVLTNLVQSLLTHAGHDAHRQDNISRVSQLNAELGVRVADGAHAERHHVHGAALHGAAEGLGHLFLHGCRRGPVIGRACVLLSLGADEGAGLHARDIRRVRARQVGVRALLLVELNQGALLHELSGEAVRLLLGAVYEDNLFRLEELDTLTDPRNELLILRGQVTYKAWNSCGHFIFSCVRWARALLSVGGDLLHHRRLAFQSTDAGDTKVCNKGHPGYIHPAHADYPKGIGL